MIKLDQCIEEQAKCAAYDGPDKEGARAGLQDWLAEECLIRAEGADYQAFLDSKRVQVSACGFDVPSGQINPKAFPFQRDIIRLAVRRGRSAIWADCGLGKTLCEIDWGRMVAEHTGLPVLIFSPLAVSEQTQREGEKFGIGVTICVESGEVVPGVDITNYEKLHRFIDPEKLGGIVLDESGILKGFDGKTRKAITEFASRIPYRLACTATPAPNDYMELGNHAEFLGIMTTAEMLAMFFCHDGGETSKWRLKRHAADVFWKWVASWAIAIRKPSDLGYEDGKFTLPPLNMHEITVDASVIPEGYLFPVEGRTLQERNSARRESIADRVTACADIVNASTEQWLIWVNLNNESTALTKAIPGAIEITGSNPDDLKRDNLLKFIAGEIRVLVSKPSICGYGLNLQNCHNVAFVGLSDSWEAFYQAVRRVWRFGQTSPVNCYVITAETEGAVLRNIQRKEKQATELMEGMIVHMKDEMKKNLQGTTRDVATYETAAESTDRWAAILGDCVEHVREIPEASIHYSIFSPPFASLYTYSNSERDMGNAKDYAEFEAHFKFLVPELYRVLMPGRLLSFHCMNLPHSKERDGFIGIRDFRGELIRMFIEAGFIYHSEVVIWKDPVTAMQRTKALGLLYKQLRKDSCMSRQGIPDYLVTMRKPGENPERVTKTHEGFPVALWQNYASPVWMDINPSDTLQKEGARAEEDERHICPLQLEVIERAIRLWTNPNDLVLSPFMGIASEGHVALKMGRRFHGIELKRSYWEEAVKNLRRAANTEQFGMFTEELPA